jgi:hypothetical protein
MFAGWCRPGGGAFHPAGVIALDVERTGLPFVAIEGAASNAGDFLIGDCRNAVASDSHQVTFSMLALGRGYRTGRIGTRDEGHNLIASSEGRGLHPCDPRTRVPQWASSWLPGG